MSYQQYMNMGFGQNHAGNPYMMGFQGGVPRQMPSAQNQYIPNHRPPPVNVPSQPMTQTWNATSPTVSAAAKRKLTNDPNRPKRPTSAYFYFVQVEREEAAKRGEKITRVAEWTKAISVKWRELTVTQKETFQTMAATDKQRYTQQMAIYTGKDANRPKRPQSAYFLWLADFRARMKDKFIENKDILRAAGEEWRKLTTMAKAPYEQRAEEERRKYEQAMKEYNLTGGVKKPHLDETPVGTATAAAAAAVAMNPVPAALSNVAATAVGAATYQLPPLQLNPVPQQQPQQAVAQSQPNSAAAMVQLKHEGEQRPSTDKDSDDDDDDSSDCSDDSEESE